ncbi:molybdenum cofactor biosynthesis protein MoaE [Candidatus Bathyarchaeota archaeon]|nr:molybdenum cofactor biosynthesis protein MoaE [Candidatus Bathyarchaeota archaeon]MBS7630811.1 molybdenum cofactor biosynthesis protein MoaE [Candidatus Bathyarchaeota archaeon]
MIEITQEDFSVDEIIKSLQTPSAGAVVTFVGIVRNESKGRAIEKIEIEVYREMALKQLESIRDEAIKQFGVENVAIIHRFGTLKTSERIMMIAVAAKHRSEAFQACRYVIENIKKRVPIWKKEITVEGDFWVEEMKL